MAPLLFHFSGAYQTFSQGPSPSMSPHTNSPHAISPHAISPQSMPANTLSPRSVPPYAVAPHSMASNTSSPHQASTPQVSSPLASSSQVGSHPAPLPADVDMDAVVDRMVAVHRKYDELKPEHFKDREAIEAKYKVCHIEALSLSDFTLIAQHSLGKLSE